jgi:hypothetical protein
MSKKRSVIFNNGCSLLSFHFKRSSVHFGVKKGNQDVYFQKYSIIPKNEEEGCYFGWIWGRVTEKYDHCIEYFGLGPFLLICWY